MSIGTSVTLYDVMAKEEISWTILGEEESNPAEGVISYRSPLAQGLLGKEEGDEVPVQLPGGTKKFEIVAVEKAVFDPADTVGGNDGLNVPAPPVT
ncbi:MAG: GreA/GreB family elongation factor [Nitrospinota bacterium]